MEKNINFISRFENEWANLYIALFNQVFDREKSEKNDKADDNQSVTSKSILSEGKFSLSLQMESLVTYYSKSNKNRPGLKIEQDNIETYYPTVAKKLSPQETTGEEEKKEVKPRV